MNNMSINILEKAVKASADINRIRILKMLMGRKLCVCEIAFVLEISQPSVSRHLKKLKTAGLIDGENEGLWTNYYLAPKNPYAKIFIENLDEWIDLDETIIRDVKRIQKADRKKLCCP